MNDDLVVLVDEKDQELGTMPKSQVHTENTPLHRAFSLFLFNHDGEVLVQQRKKDKRTWGGVWSNSCCGHVAPGETYEEAVVRRTKQELGVEIGGLTKVSDYRYRFEENGVVENEICPVYRGVMEGEIKHDRGEIEAWKWMNWGEWMKELENDEEGKWSPWCKEEVLLLDPSERVS